MRTTDHILGAPRGTAEVALSNVNQPEKIDRDYIYEVYTVAPNWHVDPAIVVSQWHLETAGGTSARWRINGNPAGMLISSPTDPDPANWTGKEAAHIHIWALAHTTDPTTFPDLEFLPSSAAYFVGRWTSKYNDPNCPTVATIDDLNIRYVDAKGEPQATWAWDDTYQDGIIERSHVLFGDTLPNQSGGTPPVAFTTTVPGLPGGPLITDYPISINLIPASNTFQRPGIIAHTPRRSVQHGTGNPNNPDAAAEARYFVNGAEGNQASVHYCTDDTKAVVVVPLNEVTWQAADGNGPGNMNGFSCEMMEADAIWNDPTRRAKLIAVTADLMGRTAARFGIGKPERHWDFNWGECCDSPCDTLCGNRHHCPDQLMSSGLWDSTYVPAWQAARIDELRRMGGGGTTTTTTTTTAAPVPPKPQPAKLPKGSSLGRVQARWNPDGVRNPRTKRVSRFSLGGKASQVWLHHVLASNPAGKTDADFAWPALESITRLGDGRLSWQWSDGFVWVHD